MGARLWIYALPYTYVGMWMLWLSDSLAAVVFFVLVMSVQSVLAWRCGRVQDKRSVMLGNAVSVAVSLVLVLLTNRLGITDATGVEWQWYFKPLDSVQFVGVAAVISLTVQAVLYTWARIEIESKN